MSLAASTLALAVSLPCGTPSGGWNGGSLHRGGWRCGRQPV